MRSIIPVTVMAILAGCTAAPPPAAAPSPRAQQQLADLLAGRTAGAPQSCLTNWRQRDMIVVDDNTIIFRESPARVWLQKPQNPCNLLSAGPYALVTRSPTGQLCRGDVGQVVDPVNNIGVGSCTMGDFVPYTRTGG